MSKELRPCPFCGSEQPQDSKDDGNVPYEFGMSRSCSSCSAAVNLGWNNRPIEDALNTRIAELEALIDQLIEVSEKMFTAVIAAADSYDEGMREWDKLVRDWKEG